MPPPGPLSRALPINPPATQPGDGPSSSNEPAGSRANYSAVRGEERRLRRRTCRHWEIPPRARRRECRQASPHGATRKYLRVHGEEPPSIDALGALAEIPPRARRRARRQAVSASPREIPPRARRRVERPRATLGGMGNTSACAEKRHCRGRRGGPTGKYLRVRGEEREMI